MKTGAAIRNVSAIVGAVLIVYVASVGPVVSYKVLKNGGYYWTEEKTYYPIERCMQASTTVIRAVDAYVDLCARLWMKCGLKTINSTNDVVNGTGG